MEQGGRSALRDVLGYFHLPENLHILGYSHQ